MPTKTVPVQIIPFLKHQGQIRVPQSYTVQIQAPHSVAQ